MLQCTLPQTVYTQTQYSGTLQIYCIAVHCMYTLVTLQRTGCQIVETLLVIIPSSLVADQEKFPKS